MTYVMSDIHGHFKALKDMLNFIEFSDQDTLYILGDVIDRGPQPIEALQMVINTPNIHMLMGNHEKMMLDYLRTTKDMYIKPDKVKRGTSEYIQWKANGGWVTLESLMDLSQREYAKLIRAVQKLPFYKFKIVNKQKFILCHANPVFYQRMGVTENLKYLCNNDEILWNRHPDNYPAPGNRIVIHGHTPVRDACFNSQNKTINIDCGKAYGNKLACLRLDDMKLFYG